MLAAVGVSQEARHAESVVVHRAAPAARRRSARPFPPRCHVAKGQGVDRRWRRSAGCGRTATGGGLCRSGRSGALLREREIRRRSRALGRKRLAPSQRPRGVGADFVPRLAARGAARRRALARPRPLRRALGAGPARPARLARGSLHGVRLAGQRRAVRDASRAAGGARAAPARAGRGRAAMARRRRGRARTRPWRERSRPAARD